MLAFRREFDPQYFGYTKYRDTLDAMDVELIGDESIRAEENCWLSMALFNHMHRQFTFRECVMFVEGALRASDAEFQAELEESFVIIRDTFALYKRMVIIFLCLHVVGLTFLTSNVERYRQLLAQHSGRSVYANKYDDAACMLLAERSDMHAAWWYQFWTGQRALIDFFHDREQAYKYGELLQFVRQLKNHVQAFITSRDQALGCPQSKRRKSSVRCCPVRT